VDAQAGNAYKDEMIRVLKTMLPKNGFLTGDPAREPAMEWRPDAIIPMRFPPRRQRDDEEIAAYTFEVEAQRAIAHFSGGTYGSFRVPADFCRGLCGSRAGQLIVRFDHLMPADFRASLKTSDQKLLDDGTLAHKTLPNFKTDKERGDGGPSIGVSGGVAMIEHQHSKQFTGSFLLAHEMGHNFYLTHAADTKADHDGKDANCTMFYPSQTTLGKARWGRGTGAGVPVPLFCGKCLLKLRGWKIRTGALPAESP
jgi:hypothetical protein